MEAHQRALEAIDLSVGYRSRRRVRKVLEGLNLSVQGGEFVCLLGPNGIGKSTLLRTFAAIQPPLGGKVKLSGEELGRLTQNQIAQRLSIVLTDRIGLGTLSAYKVVELGRFPHTGWGGRLTPYDHGVVRHAIGLVDAVHLASRDVNELSDGERQRIMVARALAQEPQLMLLDEPTAFLDVSSRVRLTGLLRRLARRNNIAIVFSTHDLEISLRSADTLWLLAPGGVLHVGGPEDLVRGGQIAEAFQYDDLVFNPLKRSFHLQQDSAGRASVKGSGLTANLARATLEREGYTVVERPGELVDLNVTTRESGAVLWEARINGVSRKGSTLAHLADFARSCALSNKGGIRS